MSKIKSRKGNRPPKNASKYTTKSKSAPVSKNLKRKLPPTTASPAPKKSKPSMQAIKPTIPFNPSDRILLVGEGDFSYAASLTTAHACRSIVATSFDSSTSVLEKYPQASAHLSTLSSAGNNIYHSIDATELSKTLPKAARSQKYDRIVFNFPHTGGLSTDVNRQVRYNQELLVKFLQSAMSLLAPTLSTFSKPTPTDSDIDDDEDAEYPTSETEREDPRRKYDDTPTSLLCKSQPTILITLFDAEPYTLWNIKDLARHVGLKSITSFAFPWEAYPGYRHARTVGNIEGKGSAWKGEERGARTYVFGLKEEVEVGPPSGGATGANAVGAKRKRGRGRESESESGEE